MLLLLENFDLLPLYHYEQPTDDYLIFFISSKDSTIPTPS